jgi:hypothetical protein
VGMYPRSWHAPLVHAASNGLIRALAHIVVLLSGYEIYRAISIASPHATAAAHAHAGSLIALEPRLGLVMEPRLQDAALHHGPLIVAGFLDGAAIRHITALIYVGSQLHWLAAMLLWLYLFRREHFSYVRNLVVVTTLAAGAFSAWYAVAPPRFALAGPPYWIEDVLHPGRPEALQVSRAVLDPYASLPSGHTLWAVLTAVGLVLGASGVAQRLSALLFPVAIVLTVMITGNHYVFDCLGALVLVLACVGLGRLIGLTMIRRRPLTAADGLPLPPGGKERRKNPNLRPLDHPLILCATAAIILLLSPTMSERLLGGAMLVGAALLLSLARHRAGLGIPLRDSTARADWWCGFFFVAGSTMVGAGDDSARLLASLLWVGPGRLPILARLRNPDRTPATAHSRIPIPPRSRRPALT